MLRTTPPVVRPPGIVAVQVHGRDVASCQFRLQSPRGAVFDRAEADAMTLAFKAKGCSWLGSTMLHAFTQQCGLLNDHCVTCFLNPCVPPAGSASEAQRRNIKTQNSGARCRWRQRALCAVSCFCLNAHAHHTRQHQSSERSDAATISSAVSIHPLLRFRGYGPR